MVDYPYTLARPGGYVDGDVPTGIELTKIDAQAAASADGSVWTDIAPLANFVPSATNPADTGDALHYIPGSASAPEKIITFGSNVNTPVGATISAPGASSTSLTVPLDDGLNSINPETFVWDGNQTYLVGGGTSSSSQARIRRSSNGGSTWASATNALAAGTQDIECMWWSAFHSKFLLAINGKIETSATGASGTWADVGALPNSDVRVCFAQNMDTGRVLVMTAAPSAARLLRSDDLVTWTQEVTPFNFERIIYSPYYGKFFAWSSGGCHTSTTGVAGSWVQVNSTNFGSIGAGIKAFVRGRIVGFFCTLGVCLSVDGGVTWTIVGPTPSGVSSAVLTPKRLVIATGGGVHFFGMRIGF